MQHQDKELGLRLFDKLTAQPERFESGHPVRAAAPKAQPVVSQSAMKGEAAPAGIGSPIISVILKFRSDRALEAKSGERNWHLGGLS